MFRSTNETMNVWTHLLGALLFIFLIYLTYAIPIENMQTMRQDVAKTNAAVLCAGSPEFMSTLFDEEHSKAACVERLSGKFGGGRNNFILVLRRLGRNGGQLQKL